MNMTDRQNELTEKLAAAGYDGKWVADRFHFGRCAELRRNGKPKSGIKAWLQFDSASTLDGVSLHVRAPKLCLKNVTASRLAGATLIAIEIVDPAQAARLRAEIEAADASKVGSMVSGEDE